MTYKVLLPRLDTFQAAIVSHFWADYHFNIMADNTHQKIIDVAFFQFMT